MHAVQKLTGGLRIEKNLGRKSQRSPVSLS